MQTVQEVAELTQPLRADAPRLHDKVKRSFFHHINYFEEGLQFIVYHKSFCGVVYKTILQLTKHLTTLISIFKTCFSLKGKALKKEKK